jgi:hypothetical protein
MYRPQVWVCSQNIFIRDLRLVTVFRIYWRTITIRYYYCGRSPPYQYHMTLRVIDSTSDTSSIACNPVHISRVKDLLKYENARSARRVLVPGTRYNCTPTY